VAFGINRAELIAWKEKVAQGEIAFITHYWLDDRFPNSKTVTKVGCSDTQKLINWGKKYGLKAEWIDNRKPTMPHYDLFGELRDEILRKEGLDHLIW